LEIISGRVDFMPAATFYFCAIWTLKGGFTSLTFCWQTTTIGTFHSNYCKNLGTRLTKCDMDAFPGPVMIIIRQAASITRSNSQPVNWPPANLSNPFILKIAPSKMTENMEPVILVRTPEIRKIPPKNSASAIGN